MVRPANSSDTQNDLMMTSCTPFRKKDLVRTLELREERSSSGIEKGRATALLNCAIIDGQCIKYVFQLTEHIHLY